MTFWMYFRLVMAVICIIAGLLWGAIMAYVFNPDTQQKISRIKQQHLQSKNKKK